MAEIAHGRNNAETHTEFSNQSVTPAVFLDRDGVIVEEVHRLHKLEQISLIPGAAEAIALLNSKRIPVVVITNQAVVARGLCTELELSNIHRHLAAMLAVYGAKWDGLFYCPHHPSAGNLPYRMTCNCRKPFPGLLLEAAEKMRINLKESVVVGDKISDLEAGIRVGCIASVLVKTGHGMKQAGLSTEIIPNYIADDLMNAVNWLLSNSNLENS